MVVVRAKFRNSSWIAQGPNVERVMQQLMEYATVPEALEAVTHQGFVDSMRSTVHAIHRFLLDNADYANVQLLVSQCQSDAYACV
jgi:hypothetical protein